MSGINKVCYGQRNFGQFRNWPCEAWRPAPQLVQTLAIIQALREFLAVLGSGVTKRSFPMSPDTKTESWPEPRSPLPPPPGFRGSFILKRVSRETRQGLDGVKLDSSCIANADSNNHDVIAAAKETGAMRRGAPCRRRACSYARLDSKTSNLGLAVPTRIH
jgi:hypothetical protein